MTDLTINVVNRRTFTGKDGDYIGRPSPLGNPFTSKQEGSKEQAIAKYRLWLNTQWRTGYKPVCDELKRLAQKLKTTGEINLVCWCAPAKCHGEIIATAIRSILDKDLL
jgi:hypothetical protein